MLKIIFIVAKIATMFPDIFSQESTLIKKIEADKNLQAKIEDVIKALALLFEDIEKGI